MAFRSEDPRLLGWCAYCDRDIYDTSLLYKERYGTSWIRVCSSCAMFQEDAKPCGPDEVIPDTMPAWESAND